VERELRKLKRNKAAGTDSLLQIFLKPVLTKSLHLYRI